MENIPFNNWGIWCRGREWEEFSSQVWVDTLDYIPLKRAYADLYKNENSKVKLLSLCSIEVGDAVQGTIVLSWCTLYEISKKKKRLVYLNSVTSHFHSKVYWLISFIFIIFSLSMVDLAPFVNNKATSNFISLAFYLKTLS